MSEEGPGVGDPEAVCPPVLEPLEVVEVAAVRDRLHPLRAELSQLLRDRLGDGDDRVGSSRHCRYRTIRSSWDLFHALRRKYTPAAL